MKVELQDGKEIISPTTKVMRYAVDCFGMEDEYHYERYRVLIGRLLWLISRNRVKAPYNNLYFVLGKKDIHVLEYAVSVGEAPSRKHLKKTSKSEVSFLKFPELLSHSIVMPHDPKAAAYYGRGTRFCTMMRDNYSHMRLYTYESKMLIYGLPRKGFPDSNAFALNIDVKHAKDNSYSPSTSSVIAYKKDSLPAALDFWHMRLANLCVRQLYQTWVDKVYVPIVRRWLEETPVMLILGMDRLDWRIMRSRLSQEFLNSIPEVVSALEDKHTGDMIAELKMAELSLTRDKPVFESVDFAEAVIDHIVRARELRGAHYQALRLSMAEPGQRQEPRWEVNLMAERTRRAEDAGILGQNVGPRELSEALINLYNLHVSRSEQDPRLVFKHDLKQPPISFKTKANTSLLPRIDIP
jgi:hypothetical protein